MSDFTSNPVVAYYIRGGPFMHPILALFLLGIAVSIWKTISLRLASINARKFLLKVKSSLQEGGVQQAVDVCANTRGPIAAIFHAGLIRTRRGIEQVEKGIVNAGAIEMAFLERGLLWLATVISLSPMLGFLGTVWGMVIAFDAIATANDISPAIVANGISQALLTTVFGLIVAITIQTANNYFVMQIDKIIVDMEESSVDLVDSLIDMEKSSS